MGVMDLNKVAVTMGKVIKLLSNLEPKIKNGNDVYEHKEDFWIIAYACRVGILNRIEKNDWMHPGVAIRIPTGMFAGKKETIGSGLLCTVGKLKELVSKDIVTENDVEDILNGNGFFYQLENKISEEVKKQLL